MIAKKEENIITIEFEEHRHIVAPALFQHNTGQVIKFNDVPDGAEVQFSNENSEKTTNKIVKDSQVEIPDFLVAEGLEITAYIQYVSVTSETTVKIISIPVEARVRQGEIVAPENEQTFREEIEGILNETKDAAKEAADKVEVNKKYLDEMEKKSTDTIENITTVGEAQINAINDTAVSQIKAINDVAQQNIKSGIDAVNAAAEAQIGGINTVADAQKTGITETAQGKIKDINNTAVSQIEAINNTATSQIKSINNVAQENINVINGVSDGNTKEIATALDMIVDTFEKKIAIEKPYYAYLMDFKIGDFNDDEITKVRECAFYEKKSLTSIDLPACTSIDSLAFNRCTSLTSIDLPACTSIDSLAFSGCTSLTSIKLANTSKICTLSDSNAFNNTPIANKAGYIYVPDELVEQYKKATNWSVYASQIKPLSAYTE